MGNLKLKEYGINQHKIFISKLQKATLLGSTPIVCYYIVSSWEELNMNEGPHQLKNWQHDFTFLCTVYNKSNYDNRCLGCNSNSLDDFGDDILSVVSVLQNVAYHPLGQIYLPNK